VKQKIDGNPTAILISDIEFYGENRRQMRRREALCRLYIVIMIECRWRYQKNGKKCEKKTFNCIGCRHDANLCGVSAWLHIIHRWSVLKLDDLHPLAVFTSSGLESGLIEFI
jgi:predicted DNA-binding ArsR family transcriptional regulator